MRTGHFTNNCDLTMLSFVHPSVVWELWFCCSVSRRHRCRHLFCFRCFGHSRQVMCDLETSPPHALDGAQYGHEDLLPEQDVDPGIYHGVGDGHAQNCEFGESFPLNGTRGVLQYVYLIGERRTHNMIDEYCWGKCLNVKITKNSRIIWTLQR